MGQARSRSRSQVRQRHLRGSRRLEIVIERISDIELYRGYSFLQEGSLIERLPLQGLWRRAGHVDPKSRGAAAEVAGERILVWRSGLGSYMQPAFKVLLEL